MCGLRQIKILYYNCTIIVLSDTNYVVVIISDYDIRIFSMVWSILMNKFTIIVLFITINIV